MPTYTTKDAARKAVHKSHTPGPWTLDEDGGYYILCNRNGSAVLLTHLRGVGGKDAHLIAAAPQLLDALKAVLRDYTDLREAAVEKHERQQTPSQKLARAAIDRAEGRQP